MFSVIYIWGISKYIMKGRTYKMMIPQHVHEIARKIQDELERQDRKYPGDYETKNSLKKIRKFRKKLNHPTLKDATYVDVLGLFQQIIETSYCLSASALDRVYKRVQIAPDLVFAMTEAYELHPEMREELDMVQDFLQSVPTVNWGTTDSFSKYKYFKLVRTEDEWERAIKRNGHNLGRNLFNYGDLQYLKIGYVESRDHYFDYLSNRVQNNFIVSEEFGKIKEAFKEWFLIGNIGTFYIYIPE